MYSVRELAPQDIKSICDYWMNASDDFLIGMGVDLEKMPDRSEWEEFLTKLIETPLNERPSYCLIWELNGKAIGHNNVSKITFGKEAFMHLHIWKAEDRKGGHGAEFLKLSIPKFYEDLQLENLYCEPWAKNPAPNKALPKVGFEFSHSYVGVPGWLNFEQKVNVFSYKK